METKCLNLAVSPIFLKFCLQQSEYGSSMIEFSSINSPRYLTEVFTFKSNLFTAFIAKNINLGIVVAFFWYGRKIT